MIRSGQTPPCQLVTALAVAFLTSLNPYAVATQPPPAGESVQSPVFSDVSRASGVRFQHLSGDALQKKYIFEAKGGGLAFVDYDGDGLMDLLIVQGSTLEAMREGRTQTSALFRNLGNGRFQDVSNRAGLTHLGWGMGATVGDYDNDGDMDLYITCLGPNRLFRNEGDGKFTDQSDFSGTADPRWSTSAAFGDYDSDGFLDLYVANYLEIDWDNLPVPGSNENCFYLGQPTYCGPLGIRASRDVLYRNNGDGTFADVTDRAGDIGKYRYNGLGVVWSDLDDDSDLDLYVANDATPNLLFINNGSGIFQERAFLAGVAVSGDAREQAGMGVDAADFDNDGLLDLFVTNFASDYNVLYRQEGNLVFDDVTIAMGILKASWLTVGWGTALFDFNHDGWQDILFANGHVYPFLEKSGHVERYLATSSLFLNVGGKRFVDASAQSGLRTLPKIAGRGVAFADFDNDGDIDYAVANLNGAPQLVRNENQRGHWVVFRLSGRKSNHFGIGARLTLTCPSGRQIREVRTARGIYSASDHRVHFGTPSDRIDRLEVKWPSGAFQTFENLEVDRLIPIDEVDGLREP